jgi:hypothetical protein
MADTSYLAPTSELMAVNNMLASIGESRVDSLANLDVEDAGIAIDTLRSVSRAIQLVGWHWNTDVDLIIDPDADGYVKVPASALKVIVTKERPDLDLVQRGVRLYDRVKHSYKFTESIKVDLVCMLPFEELPEAARQFIFVSAGRTFQQGTIGNVTLDRFSEGNVKAALLALEAAEAETGRYNILTGSWSVFRIVNRVVPPT